MKYLVVKGSQFGKKLIYLQEEKIKNNTNKNNGKIPWFGSSLEGAAYFKTETDAKKWLWLKQGGEPRIVLVEDKDIENLHPRKRKQQTKTNPILF